MLDYEPERPGCDSKYGCCPDGTSSATGPKYAGCPGRFICLLITISKFDVFYYQVQVFLGLSRTRQKIH